MNYIANRDGSILNLGTGKTSFGSKTSTGYMAIKVGGKSYRVHRLIAEEHIPNPDNRSDVDHIDCDRSNNNVSNLRWLTHGANIKHSYDTDGRSAVGVCNARCRTDEDTVRGICQLLQEGHKSSKIRDMGYNYSLTRQIKSRNQWTHVSGEYSF